MDQTKIWEQFQNNDEIGNTFRKASSRYLFIARQISTGASVLNVGVARGGLESILINKGINVSCLDPSENSINTIRESYQLGENAQVGFSQAMPFSDGQFDVVVMSEVLEHLPDEILIRSLEEVRRVLKPNGRFIGTVPANENLLDNKTVCPHCGEIFHRWGHEQSFSKARLRDLLIIYNFSIIRIEMRAFPDWQRKGIKNFIKCILRSLLGRVGSPISWPNIYFEVQR